MLIRISNYTGSGATLKRRKEKSRSFCWAVSTRRNRPTNGHTNRYINKLRNRTSVQTGDVSGKHPSPMLLRRDEFSSSFPSFHDIQTQDRRAVEFLDLSGVKRPNKSTALFMITSGHAARISDAQRDDQRLRRFFVDSPRIIAFLRSFALLPFHLRHGASTHNGLRFAEAVRDCVEFSAGSFSFKTAATSENKLVIDRR